VEKSYDVPYSVSADGIITFVGRQIEQFGHTPEEVISKHYLDFVVTEQRQQVMQK